MFPVLMEGLALFPLGFGDNETKFLAANCASFFSFPVNFCASKGNDGNLFSLGVLFPFLGVRFGDGFVLFPLVAPAINAAALPF
tara:strand:- start:60 stop:311 length:252 start_codon:yes stop_codon:yes gene_type:complete